MVVTREGRHFPKHSWAKWRDEMILEIAGQFRKYNGSINKPCEIHVNYWRGDDRRRDVSGMLDAIFHVLEKAGVVTDDSLFKSVIWLDQKMDRKNPRAQILIIPC